MAEAKKRRSTFSKRRLTLPKSIGNSRPASMLDFLNLTNPGQESLPLDFYEKYRIVEKRNSNKWTSELLVESKIEVQDSNDKSSANDSTKGALDKKEGKRYLAKVYKKKTLPNSEIIIHKRENLVSSQIHQSKNAKSSILSGVKDQVENESYLINIESDYESAGENLQQRLRDEKSIPEKKMAIITLQILLGLKCLHDMNLVHRALSAETIWFLRRSKDFIQNKYLIIKKQKETKSEAKQRLEISKLQVKINNFEHAKLAPTSGYKSSLPYKSPESVRTEKEEVNLKSDMWSLGVIVFLSLSGEFPFFSKNKEELEHLIKKGSYAFRTGPWLGISKDAKNFVKQLLKRQPRSRFDVNKALNHPWMKKAREYSEFKEIDGRIRQTKAKSLLKESFMVLKFHDKVNNNAAKDL